MMDIDRLYTIRVRCRPDSCLIIPVRIDTAADLPDHAPWTRLRASLTAAQSEALFRHALAFPDLAEQVRDLARGRFDVADLESDPMAGSDLPHDDRRGEGIGRDVRCPGGRVYWW